MDVRLSFIFILLLMTTGQLLAGDEIVYSPSKVIYDFSDPDPVALDHMLDRAGLLQRLYQNDIFEASIVFVVHEGAIPLFAKNPKKTYPELMDRARSLARGEIIQFRLCKASAKMQGFKENQIQNFVVQVPMADAEIVKLQQQGYAYLR